MSQLVAKFKASKFDTPAEVDAFMLAEGAAPDALSIVKCLEVLTARGAASEAIPHRRRCGVFAKMAEKVVDQKLFGPYVKALKAASSDQTLRQALIPLIPRVSNISEHPLACSLLESSDDKIRQAVVPLLSQLGGKVIFQEMQRYLKDKKFVGRLEAIEVAARVAQHHALPVFQEILMGGTPTEKMTALKFLGDPKLMAKDLLGALKCTAAALNDSTEQVAVYALAGFGRMCTEDDWFAMALPVVDSPRVALVKAAIEGLVRFSSPRVTQVLERKFRAGPNAVRLAVLGVLQAIGNDDILGALVDALSARAIQVRTRAGEILQELSKAGKVDISRTIVYLLRSKDVNLRRMAVELAKSIKDPHAELWPKLLGVLRDEDWWVRERVVDVLVELAGPQLTRHIVQYLSDPSDVVRRFAVDVLNRLKDPQALGAVVRVAAGDVDWWAREKAIECIAALNDPRAVPYLIDLMAKNVELQWSCVQALSQMKATQAAPQVASLLQSPDSDVRLVALNCLKVFNDPSYSTQVRALANDRELDVKMLARELLTYWSVAFQGADGAAVGDLAPLDKLLVAMAQRDGDDLILASGKKPVIKKQGVVLPLVNNPLSFEQIKNIIYPKLTPNQVSELEAGTDIDISYEVRSEGLRFRANIFNADGGVAAVFRIIKGTLIEAEKLGVPQNVISFGDFKNGLVLVGGPTGSGKSTTLAALIDYINRKESAHIISLEDPIEVVHLSKKALVTQRELGTHTHDFKKALRSTLREDPDVILVGELRDYATIQFAVTAAETGHLVFGTVHTAATDTTVDRMVSAFPAGQHEQVRSMLSESLRAVVCQYLIKGMLDNQRHLALEVMINNDAIAALIRKNKAFQIPSVISTSRESGMQTMDQDLMRLVKETKISPEEAYVKARSKKDFEPLLNVKRPLLASEEAAAKAALAAH